MVNPSPEIWPGVETELGRETPDLTHKSDLKDKGGGGRFTSSCAFCSTDALMFDGGRISDCCWSVNTPPAG